jgi:hypothetical protein
MWEWLKTTQGLLAALAAVLGIMGAWWQLGLPRVVFSDGLKANHDRTDRVNHFNGDTPVLALDQTLVAPIPLGLIWPESDPAFVTSKPIPITFVRSAEPKTGSRARAPCLRDLTFVSRRSALPFCKDPAAPLLAWKAFPLSAADLDLEAVGSARGPQRWSDT